MMMKKLKAIRNWNNLNQSENYLLYEIENAIQEKFLKRIRELQAKTTALRTNELGYLAYQGGELTPGCKDCCLVGSWAQVRSSSECTRDCKFCYHFGVPSQRLHPNAYRIGNEYLDERGVKLFLKHGQRPKGIAWVYYEPLMYINKIIPIMEFLSNNNIYQWLNTNGDLATKSVLQSLAKAGLNEIRFNLAASNCSNEVIENIAIASDLFEYVCIESPMFSGYFKSFVEKRKMILDAGVTHIYCAELQLFPATVKHWAHEGDIYRYNMGYISPVNSRILTYKLMELSSTENWDVVIHDCSNETKFYRGVTASGDNIDYQSPDRQLPPKRKIINRDWFIRAAEILSDSSS